MSFSNRRRLLFWRIRIGWFVAGAVVMFYTMAVFSFDIIDTKANIHGPRVYMGER